MNLVQDVHESFSPRYRRAMSYKHVGTPGDLVRFGCSLKVECTACGAAATLSGMEVFEAHGRARIDRLAPRLKCRRCNRKAAKLTVLPPV